MQSSARTIPISNTSLWGGRVLSALPVLFMLFDGAIKFVKLAPVVQAFSHLGLPLNIAAGIGILELACVLLYVLPQTAILGAILLTGYLGGATAMHVRIGDPFVFPIVIGALIWGGLYLRDERLRTLVPLRS